jgi:hypothetical protein
MIHQFLNPENSLDYFGSVCFPYDRKKQQSDRKQNGN